MMRKKIIDIIVEESGVKYEKVLDTSRLESDLGITGDDLWLILERMDKVFDIDWKETDFSYFFYPECTGFFWGLVNRDKASSIRRYPITVAHLVEVAKTGVWFTPKRFNTTR